MLAVLVTPLDRSLIWIPHTVNSHTNRHLGAEPYAELHPSMIQGSEYAKARKYNLYPGQQILGLRWPFVKIVSCYNCILSYFYLLRINKIAQDYYYHIYMRLCVYSNLTIITT
jgi:hypothetical protein